ncbi:MAG: replication initiation protein [Bacteroidota bacterium]
MDTIEKIGNGSLIVKSNYLVNAEYRLTPIEMKIIYLMAMQVRKGDEDFKTYQLRIKDFQEDLGLKDNHALYERMIEIVKRLMGRVVQIRYENGNVEQFPFVTWSMHKHKEGTIGIIFVPKLKPHMIDLKERFTSFYDYNVLSLRSQYSMRIYELIKQYERIGKRTISVADLRRMLRLQDKYRSYNMFKKKVIEQAKKDLDNHCDISFEFTEKKSGRKIAEIDFIILKKRLPKQIKTKTERKQGVKEVEIAFKELGLSQKQTSRYLNEEGREPEYLLALIEETQKGYKAGRIKNPSAYLVSLIERNANTKTASQMLRDKEEQANEALRSAQLAKQEKDTVMIENWREEYEVERDRRGEKLLESTTGRDIDMFRGYVKNNPYLRKKLLLENNLNTSHKEFSFWFKNFLLPEYEPDFISWIHDNKGYSIVARNGEYQITGKQESLFN